MLDSRDNRCRFASENRISLLIIVDYKINLGMTCKACPKKDFPCNNVFLGDWWVIVGRWWHCNVDCLPLFCQYLFDNNVFGYLYTLQSSQVEIHVMHKSTQVVHFQIRYLYTLLISTKKKRYLEGFFCQKSKIYFSKEKNQEYLFRNFHRCINLF